MQIGGEMATFTIEGMGRIGESKEVGKATD